MVCRRRAASVLSTQARNLHVNALPLGVDTFLLRGDSRLLFGDACSLFGDACLFFGDTCFLCSNTVHLLVEDAIIRVAVHRSSEAYGGLGVQLRMRWWWRGLQHARRVLGESVSPVVSRLRSFFGIDARLSIARCSPPHYLPAHSGERLVV
jgi:hypothetical protein